MAIAVASDIGKVWAHLGPWIKDFGIQFDVTAGFDAEFAAVDGGSCFFRRLSADQYRLFRGVALLEPLLFFAAALAASAGLILQLGLRRVFSVAPRLKPRGRACSRDVG